MIVIYEEHNKTYDYHRIMVKYNKTHNTEYNKKCFHHLVKLSELQTIIHRKNSSYHYYQEDQIAENSLARKFTAEKSTKSGTLMSQK